MAPKNDSADPANSINVISVSKADPKIVKEDLKTSDVFVYNHRVVIDDIKTMIENKAPRDIYSHFEIPIKNSSLPSHIEINPCCSKDVGYLSVYFGLDDTISGVKNVKAKYEFSVISMSEKKKNVRSGKPNEVSSYAKHGRGFSKYLKHSALFDPLGSLLNSKGSLTINGKITITTDKSSHFHEDTKHSNTVLKRLLEDPERFGDFIIVCSDDEEVKCSSNILAANSEVFEVNIELSS